jgi:hypothetical protein
MKHAGLLSAAAVIAAPAIALGNGRYPAGSQLVVDPTNPDHIVVSATFGVLQSRDGGKTFGWMCEKAIGTSGQQDLMLAIPSSGDTVVAMFNGITMSADGCTWSSAPELADKTMGDLAWSRSTPSQLLAFWLQFKGGSNYDSQIVQSNDNGQSWSPVGGLFPADLYPLTIDVAPSNPSRVYLSARGGATKNFESVLMRSDDGGATFTSADVPQTEEHRLAFIAAVHPIDADRVYLRIFDMPSTVIQMSRDGGRTFQKIMTGTEQLLGFAISPDGTQMAVGGPNDGLYIGSADGTNLARRSDVGATCLTWTKDALYACADYKAAGFSIGRSIDSGATFEGLFRYDTLCGRAGCGGNTTARCAEEWELIAPAVGATCGADAGADVSTGGTSRDAGSAVEGGNPTTGGSPPPVDDDAGGCAIAGSRRVGSPCWSWAWLVGVALPLRRRMRPR